MDEQLTCEHEDKHCRGTVEHHLFDTGTGYRGADLCDYHYEEREAAYERAREYQSPCRPDWFDEGYAGERWDDDY